MKTSMKSCVVVLAVLLLLPVMAASDEQLVPKLEITVNPGVVVVRPPCPVTRIVTVMFRNASLTESITVDWSSIYLEHDLECVADYDPKGGTVGPIAPQEVVAVPCTLSFICECVGKTRIQFSGVVQGDPVDTDSDILQVNCVRGVPSLSNLGLLILAVLLLGSGIYVAYRRRVREVY